MDINPYENIWFKILVAYAIFLNVVWYMAKAFVKKRGHEIHYLSNHFSDVGSLLQIYREPANIGDKYTSAAYLALIISGIFVFFGLAYKTLVSIGFFTP